MSFIWPRALLLLLAVPALVRGYVWLLHKRERDRAALGTMGQVQSGSGAKPGRRRHAPVVIFLIAITLLIFGLSRPQATIDAPHKEGTIVLAFDVSGSMAAKDLQPSRIAAAKSAARRFVAAQPASIKIGVVAFSDDGRTVQEPTSSKAEALAAIDRLEPRGGTSLGHAIFASLDAISEKPLTLDPDTVKNGSSPRIPYLGSATVILLTDGEDTSRLDPLTFATLASKAGVRIDPIGLGSAAGTVVQIDGFSVATRLDADVLKQIAKQSNGTYFRAEDATSLQKVYDNIDLKLTIKGEKTEITAIFAGVGLLLLIIGAGLSMRWYGRAP